MKEFSADMYYILNYLRHKNIKSIFLCTQDDHSLFYENVIHFKFFTKKSKELFAYFEFSREYDYGITDTSLLDNLIYQFPRIQFS